MTTEKILLQFKPEKSDLLPAIKKIQEELGYISQESVNACAEFFQMKPAEVYSAASFYDHIELENPAPVVIQVCDSANCCSKNSEDIINEVERLTGARAGDANGKIKIKRESCFGLCAQGPIMKVNGTIFEKMSPERVDDILSSYLGPGSLSKL